MYMPAHFSENRFDVLRNLIHQHPLASMVSMEADGMTANHIPFIITPPTTEAPFGKLLGHVARANPVWQNRESVLLIFRDRRLTLHLAGTKKKNRQARLFRHTTTRLFMRMEKSTWWKTTHNF